MSQNWASMSTSGQLTLNAEPIDLPKDIGEFVIVHEVLHLIAPVFKSFLYAYMPNWQEREKQLREAKYSAPGKSGRSKRALKIEMKNAVLELSRGII